MSGMLARKRNAYELNINGQTIYFIAIFILNNFLICNIYKNKSGFDCQVVQQYVFLSLYRDMLVFPAYICWRDSSF